MLSHEPQRNRNPFWAKMAERLHFLTPEEKEGLAGSGEVFLVTQVTYRPTGKFGANWLLRIMREIEGDPVYQYITLPARDYRQEFMEVLQNECAVSPVPAVLVKFISKNGQEGWTLGEPPEDWAEQLSLTYAESDPNF